MNSLFLVFVGAGVGGVLRHGVNLLSAQMLGAGFPWGTLIVNVVGSFAMGLMAALVYLRAGWLGGETARLLLMTGVLGGFTTFSAFSLDAITLLDRGQLSLTAVYVTASVMLSIAALLAGAALVRSL
jgi:fluoride exporter